MLTRVDTVMNQGFGVAGGVDLGFREVLGWTLGWKPPA